MFLIITLIIVPLNNEKVFSIFIISTILITACCKDKNSHVAGCQKEKPPPDEHHYYWLGEAKDYMYFKHGTWWVYKNVQNGKTDTVYVTLSRLDTTTVRGQETYSSHRIYTYETCRIVTKSTNYNKFYDWYSRDPNPDVTNVASQNTVWVRQKSGGRIKTCFHTPFIVQLRTDAVLLNSDTTIRIAQKIFNNVKIFQLPRDATYMDILFNDPTYVMDYTLLYYAPQVGIIKSEVPNRNISIELIKYNINQYKLLNEKINHYYSHGH